MLKAPDLIKSGALSTFSLGLLVFLDNSELIKRLYVTSSVIDGSLKMMILGKKPELTVK